ncbi:hypothetical protein [Streptomyces macrosporus]|uniref:Uncharacterized protein n=1 Tax=Streptomyces macrosporus TaxID=44032 RepID=A0ABP5XVM6_9ACTN
MSRVFGRRAATAAISPAVAAGAVLAAGDTASAAPHSGPHHAAAVSYTTDTDRDRGDRDHRNGRDRG